MVVRDYSVIKKEQDELLAKQKQADKDAQNKIYDTTKKTITDNYTNAIDSGIIDYEDDYRDNAVQKKVNEFYIAEEMANMGLTNSGLNRTQITANQLSYANNKAKIDRQKQNMIDELTREMNNKLTDAENENTSKLAAIDSGYEELATKNANDIYKSEWEAYTKEREAELEAETARQKAYYSALANAKPQNIINSKNGVLSRKYTGSLAENKVSVTFDTKNNTTTYTDRVTGYSSTFASNVNPYTNTVNPNTEYGTFSGNPYQPNNLGKDRSGKVLKLRAAKKTDTGETATYPMNGQNQTVWTVDGKTFYIWNGAINDYEILNPDKTKGVLK
jgi:hypothetical protein